ncbi:MAG: hypothetical protein J7L34_04225, partial [Thermotogaceae bacterium]|nr:hypothetical protein [Thermotogaceae bacterium]
MINIKEISDLGILNFFSEGATLHDGKHILYANDAFKEIFKMKNVENEMVHYKELNELLKNIQAHLAEHQKEPFELEFDLLLEENRKKFNT